MVTQDHPWQMSLNKIISLNYACHSIVFGAGNFFITIAARD